MGSSSREKPQTLAEKLLQIRLKLHLSQNEMLRHLGLEEKLIRSDISKYERGVREPSLLTLLEYSRVIGVSTDVLINDELELPNV
jgi:transcriptional regulator with XRE-family HTH domain